MLTKIVIQSKSYNKKLLIFKLLCQQDATKRIVQLFGQNKIWCSVLTSPAKNASTVIILYTLILIRSAGFIRYLSSCREEVHLKYLCSTPLCLCGFSPALPQLTNYCSLPELSATPFPSTVFRSCWSKAGKVGIGLFL